MNHTPNEPKNPDPINAAWEDAMTRDFDARVRDLHEAPLDIGSVKGKAHQIKRNRRAAVAGGVLGVAAVITPIAVIVGGDGDTDSNPPPIVDNTDTPETEAPDPTENDPEYVRDGVWYQADGEAIPLPEHDYTSAVLWQNQLVATFYSGEVFATTIIVADDGALMGTIDTSGPVVVDDSGTVAAWVQPDGEVIVDEGEGGVVVGNVDMAAAGDTEAWAATAVGGPDCVDSGVCPVYLKSALGADARAVSPGSNEVVADGISLVSDATSDGVLSVRTKTTEFLDTCNGLFNTEDGDVAWETCNYQVHQISPDGRYVVAPPSQYDGNGPLEIAVLDTVTMKETARFAPEGGFIGTWAWTSEGHLLFTAYDGANWHLFSMAPDTMETTELIDPVKGDEVDSPFTLIQR